MRTFVLGFSVAVLAGCTCSNSSGDRPGGDGDGGSQPDAPGLGLVDSGGGGGGDSCGEDASKYVYLVDEAYNLLRFDPTDNSLSSVGKIGCSPDSTPFSMAIDRNATAYVLYADGNVYRVNTTTLACTPTSVTPGGDGFLVFGMGFAANAPGSEEETLFIGGAAGAPGVGTPRLGTLDVSTFGKSAIGNLPGWPEMTGTGDAELWAFFPDTTPPSVRQLDKATGQTSNIIDVSEITGQPRAWAFAFWGGRFYIFYRGETASSEIFRVERNGTVQRVVRDSGYTIVGAGVSTCAPTILQ
jgi:hypothetical protein